MSLLGIPFDKIVEADIVNLKTMRIQESPTLDYKQESYGNSDKDRKEFLSDISSFANTLGGDLLIGVAEDGGFPTEIKPLSCDIDVELRRLESIALSGIEPRLSNLRIRSIPVEGGHVILLRVQRSFSPPHRVSVGDTKRFWARAGTQKYEPNVAQLRQLFVEAPAALERIRAFHLDRLAKISAGETPARLRSTGKLVVQAVPLPAFVDGRMSDIIREMARGKDVPVAPYGFGFASNAFNLEGYLSYAALGNEIKSYAQFFRNGAIEGVCIFRANEQHDGRTHFIERDIINIVVSSVRNYLDVLKSYDLGLPVYVYVALCNAEGLCFRYAEPDGFGWSETKPLAREVVSLPEVFVDDFEIDVIDAMRPIFNTIWNAFGFESCERYRDVAKWKAGNPYALTW